MVHIEQGNNRDLKLIINDESFSARLVNINRKEIDVDTLQLRYDSNDDFRLLSR